MTSDGVRTSPLSGQPDLIAGLTPEVEAVLQASIEDGYRDFVELVSETRNMTPQQVDRIAQGRVWDGGTARQIGLVDAYGGMDEALAWAAKAANLGSDGWHAVYLGHQPSATDALLRQWVSGADQSQRSDVFALFARKNEATMYRVATDLERLSGTSGAQAYCLACPVQASAQSRQRVRVPGWAATIASILRN